MNDSNKRTLDAYEAHVQEYIDGTPQIVTGVVKAWLDSALAGLPKNARILEIGSAFGRDAAYMQSHGYNPLCTDATQAFVTLLQRKGFDARLLNVLTDELGGPYDLVLANAVLLHFNRDEVKLVLRKVFTALKDGGIFAFTVKQGKGEEWSDSKLGAPRYFCYWQEEALTQLLKDVGFRSVSIQGDVATARATWLQAAATK